jgi:hypothetical protein
MSSWERLWGVCGQAVVPRHRTVDFVAFWPSVFSPSANRVHCEEDVLAKNKKKSINLIKIY